MQEIEIVRNCQNGDLKAYQWIYDRYGEPMLHMAKRFLISQQDAEDAVQETFVKLFRAIHNFKFQSKFSTYLFQIHTHVCFDILKKRKRMQLVDIKESDHSYHSQPDLKMQLEEAITKLPERMQACFILWAIEGFKQKEIAEILNISIGGVKSNIFQAKMKLKSILNEKPIREIS